MSGSTTDSPAQRVQANPVISESAPGNWGTTAAASGGVSGGKVYSAECHKSKDLATGGHP